MRLPPLPLFVNDDMTERNDTEIRERGQVLPALAKFFTRRKEKENLARTDKSLGGRRHGGVLQHGLRFGKKPVHKRAIA